MTGTGEVSKRIVEEEQVHWWQLSDGKVVRMTHVEDTAQGVAAARGGRV